MRPRRLLAGLLALCVLLTLVPAGSAQPQPGTAELKRVSGRVEMLRKGQTQWLPAVVGGRLAEGDDVRAFAGASAELEMPDGSTLVVAENSRILISKLQFDPQNQSRLAVFHLAVGKVLATVSQATLTLVRARQSNFVITTPTAVAAARGTFFEVVHDVAQQVTRVAVIRKDPKRHTQGLVTCSSFYDRFRPVAIPAGYAAFAGTAGCSPLIRIDQLGDPSIGTTANTLPPPPPEVFTGTLTPPPFIDVLSLVTGIAPPPLGPVFFGTEPSVDTTAAAFTGISTVGADIAAPPSPCPAPVPTPPGCP